LEFRYGMAKPYIYVQRLFTDNGADEKATKFEIIESHEHYRLNLASQNAKFVKHFYLYMLVEGLQSYIKVYSLMYNYDSSAATKFTIAPVKKVRYIEDCSNFWAHSFITYKNSFVDYYKGFEDIFEEENVVYQKKDPGQKSQIIPENMESADARKVDYQAFLNYQVHKNLMLETEYKDAIIVQEKTSNRFKLYLGKECVFEFGIKEEVFKHKVHADETPVLKNIKDGIFVMECMRRVGQTLIAREIHLDQTVPMISDPFLVSILKVFLSVYDSKIYYNLVRDTILNCFVFSADIELQHGVLQPGHLRHRGCPVLQLQGDQHRHAHEVDYLLRLSPLNRRDHEAAARRLGRLVDHAQQVSRTILSGTNQKAKAGNRVPKEELEVQGGYCLATAAEELDR
jgi:hypothetical protein